MLVKWGIRLPNQFLSYNTLLQSENQAKVAYFTKLMILIFWCPEETRITNFTRMPQHWVISKFCQFSSLTEVFHWSISPSFSSGINLTKKSQFPVTCWLYGKEKTWDKKILVFWQFYQFWNGLTQAEFAKLSEPNIGQHCISRNAMTKQISAFERNADEINQKSTQKILFLAEHSEISGSREI